MILKYLHYLGLNNIIFLLFKILKFLIVPVLGGILRMSQSNKEKINIKELREAMEVKKYEAVVQKKSTEETVDFVGLREAVIKPCQPIGSRTVMFPQFEDIDSIKVYSTARIIGPAKILREARIKGVIRVDEGWPIVTGQRFVMEEGSVLHALEVDKKTKHNMVEGHIVEGSNETYCAIWIGDDVVMGQNSQVHGPAYIGDGVELMHGAFAFRTKVTNSILGPGAAVIGVDVDGKFIPPGKVVTKVEDLKDLPTIGEAYRYSRQIENAIEKIKEEEQNFVCSEEYEQQGYTQKTGCFVHPTVKINGVLKLGKDNKISPYANLNGRIRTGDVTNIQDEVVIYTGKGKMVIGDHNSLAHQAKIKCGCENIKQDEICFETGVLCFIGMKTKIHAKKIKIGNKVTFGPCSGIDIPDGEIEIPDETHIPAGFIIKSKADFEEVLELNRTDAKIHEARKAFAHMATEVAGVNEAMAKVYNMLFS